MAAFPVVPLDVVTGGRTALILAPHADDESLGCGGLIATAVAAGQPPFVLILTDGTGSHPHSARYPPARLKALREAEARAAVELLGLPADRIGFLGLTDTASPMEGHDFQIAVGDILKTAGACGAATVLAPWEHDPHGDHLSAHRMAQAVAGRGRLRHLAYPVWGWMLPADRMLPGEKPQGYQLDISFWAAAKQAAIGAHASQYSDLIDDDPQGFRLPPGLLTAFSRPYETFVMP